VTSLWSLVVRNGRDKIQGHAMTFAYSILAISDCSIFDCHNYCTKSWFTVEEEKTLSTILIYSKQEGR
jgi:hypothetical protein